jgi:hypothetical protein
MTNKDLLKVIGFPRSGNTLLNRWYIESRLPIPGKDD